MLLFLKKALIAHTLETTMTFENYDVAWAISDHLSSGHSEDKNKTVPAFSF